MFAALRYVGCGKEKVAIVSLYQSYPPFFGAAAVTYGIYKYLPTEKVLIQIGQHRATEIVDSGRIITVPGLMCGKEMSSRWCKFARMPFTLKEILNLLISEQPDCVILEGASWALYYWALFKMIRRALPSARVVYHDHNIEYELRRARNGFLVQRLTYYAEKALLRNADISLVVSERDAQLAENLYSVSPEVLPNGVDVERFEVSEHLVTQVRRKYGIEDNAILFMGSPAYPPNAEAIRILTDTIFPLVLANVPDAQLVVIGGTLRSSHDFVVNPGLVPWDELSAIVAACKVSVAPIVSGSGTRLKVLESMAAGKPVVATHKGAEGLLVRHGYDIFLTDKWEEFAQFIVKLLRNPDLAATIGERARRTVERHYSYERVAKRLVNLMCLA